MNDFAFVNDLVVQFSAYIPNLVGALALLLAGWLIALLAAGVVKGALRRTTFDERVASWLMGDRAVKSVEVERLVAKLVFYFILLITLVAFFETLGLTLLANSLDNFLSQISAYLPRLIEAGFVLLLAWVVASVSRLVMMRVLSIAKIDKKLEVEAGIRQDKKTPLARTIAEAVYWLIFLLFLPAFLEALELKGLLEPVQGMTNEILNFLPNILAAALVLLVGWFVARIVQRIAKNLLEAVGVDSLGERVGISAILGKQTLSGVLGVVAYVLVFLPVLLGSLDALGLEAVTQPASNMLNIILVAIPSIFAAGIVMIFAYVAGRIVSGLVSNLLSNVGFDNVLALLGFGKGSSGKWKPSEMVGYLVMVAIILFALIEALSLLGFGVLADLAAEFIVFSGHIIFGLVIFAIGMYLANAASQAVSASKSKQADFLSLIARISILIFAGAMALRQMGLANEIINIAFALIVGAVAVAFALALGLGGRDVAGKQLDEWVKTLKKKK
jgi:hypothetical protein